MVAVVDHEPRHDLRKLFRVEGSLKHCDRVRPDGRTSHFLLKRRNYTGEVLESGEICWARDPRDVATRNKLDRRWTAQVWLGKVESSDEHVWSRGTPADKYRTVRRRPATERWDLGIFDACTATPWTDGEQLADAATTTRATYITRARVLEPGGVLRLAVPSKVKYIVFITTSCLQITIVDDNLVFDSRTLGHNLTRWCHDAALTNHVETFFVTAFGNTNRPSGVLITTRLKHQMIVKGFKRIKVERITQTHR